MTTYDPTVNERMKKFCTNQVARGQKNVRAWVDNAEFERGYAMYDATSQIVLLEELKTSIDQAALVLGWRKAMNERLERSGTRDITQVKLDYELSQLQKLGPDSVILRLDLGGNMTIEGPATAKQLSALARLSERVRKNGQAKN